MTIRVLTKTEEDVARLVAAGRTEAEVASELGLSPSVVAAYVSGTLRKLGARSPAELAELLADAPAEPRQSGG